MYREPLLAAAEQGGYPPAGHAGTVGRDREKQRASTAPCSVREVAPTSSPVHADIVQPPDPARTRAMRVHSARQRASGIKHYLRGSAGEYAMSSSPVFVRHAARTSRNKYPAPETANIEDRLADKARGVVPAMRKTARSQQTGQQASTWFRTPWPSSGFSARRLAVIRMGDRSRVGESRSVLARVRQKSPLYVAQNAALVRAALDTFLLTFEWG